MTAPLTTDERAAAITAVAERGKYVYVVFGVYLDMSGAKVLGVYTDQGIASQHVEMAKAAGAALSVNYAKMPLNTIFAVELRP